MTTVDGASTVTSECAMPRFSAEERAARGKAERAEIPRAAHGTWEAPPHRRDPIALLEQQATSRIPELVPIRYGRMLVSPFTFYRGAACVMASDLAATTRSGLRVQLCGDAHLSNFGVSGSAERRLVFDINDFDETLPGPWDWDVKRLAASMELAGRDNGFSRSERSDIVLKTVREYREAMRSFAALRNLDVWYARLDIEQIFDRFRSSVGRKRLRVTERNLAKARTKDSIQAYEMLTHEVGGRRRIISDPPLIVRVEGAGGIERDFYVRQLRDWKFSVDIAALDQVVLTTYGRLCGWTLARAHARSGDRIAIAAYLGKADTFDKAIAAFAIAYADQTERDHKALAAAVKNGRIQAETGL
ncbi:DUF2252 family protein [Sorangium sp. So ce269]